MNSTTASLLLVEDDEIDIESVKRSLKKNKLLNPLFIAHDGIEALEMLRGENGNDKIETPIIVLLDINMPRMDGFEFLDELRKDKKLHNTIVFVLTTSSSDEDMMKAYANNIAGYIVKSNASDGFLEVIHLLDNYWRVVELPKE